MAGRPITAGDRDFARHVQTALSDLYDPAALQTHGLTRYVRGLAAGPGSSPSPRGAHTPAGRWLRQALLDAVASLRPASVPGQVVDNRAARAHQLLHLRYVEGLDPPAIQSRLGISKSLYYLEHKRALDAVTATLAERWSISDGTPLVAGDRQSLAASTLPDRPPLPSLPAALTSFVGRVRDREQLLRLLAPETPSRPRLLTLTGPAGAGKTRLALETARTLAAAGLRVLFVDLTAVLDPALVLPAIASRLGVRGANTASDDAEGAIQALTTAVAGEELLLVLDNFEHVLAAGGTVGALLRAEANLRALVTSREPLGIYGEWEIPVEPLPLPPSDVAGSDRAMEMTAQNEAVRLFVERAQAARPDFSLTLDNAPAVAQIIRRLDGLPLAIELAAAHTRVLTPVELLARLERGLALAEGPRDVPPRQRTLTGAIAWSYRLLDASEQRLLRNLAIFSGGATRAGVTDVSGEEVADRLESLVAKSLVKHERHADGGTRYTLFETIRAFARDRLLETEEADLIGERHAAHYLAMVEEAEGMLSGADQARWLTHLERDYGNVRAAVRWFIERGRSEEGLRLAGALRQFWLSHGHWSEGRLWLADLLALSTGQYTAARAKALDRAAVLAGFQGDHALARGFYDEAVAIWRALGDDQGTGRSRTGLGNVALSEGDFAGAKALYAESAALLRAAGDEPGVGNALGMLGIAHYLSGEYEDAERHTSESLRVRRSAGDQAGVAHALNMLGSVARCSGRYDDADTHYVRCLEVCDELGHRLGTATVLYNRAMLTMARGAPIPTAAELLKASVELFRALEDKRGLALCVEATALMAAPLDPARSAWLFGSAEFAVGASGVRRPPADQAACDAAIASLRERLSVERFAAEWAAGRTAERSEAVQRAAALLDGLSSKPD